MLNSRNIMLHVKLTVYYTVSFTCNLYFLPIQLVLHVTYISLIQHILWLINLRVTNFRGFFAVEYVMKYI